MKSKELIGLIKTSYHQVGLRGKETARIYHAMVELDGQVRMWRKRAEDLGWTDALPPEEAKLPE